jgi:hypothetical protein
MGKTWNEKLTGSKPPHTAVLEKPFAGLKPGETLFIPSPLMVRDYMRAIPYGERRSVGEMRAEMAARHGAKATCPLTASLFARIAAEAAWEDLQAGKGISEIAPFWRLIDADSALGRRLSCGQDFIETTRANEARLSSALAAEVSACTT